MAGWRMSRRLAVVTLVCATVVVASTALSVAWAAKLSSSEKNVVIGPGQTINDDLYASGNRVSIEGTVSGDLIVAANTVSIDGTVAGDVFVLAREVEVRGRVGTDLMGAAQIVTLDGAVDDDMRVAAQTVQVGKEGEVKSDLLAAEYSLDLQPGSRVGGDLFVAAYQALLGGDVGWDVRAACAAIKLDGQVGRSVFVEVGDADDGGPPPTFFMPGQTPSTPSVPTGLTLGEKAKIAGKLIYTSATKADMAPGARVAGGVVRKKPVVKPGEEDEKATPASWALDQLRRLAALLLIGLPLVWLVPGWLTDLGDRIKAKPAPSLGWGLVAFLVFIAAVLCVAFVTIVGAVLFGAATIGGVVGAFLSAGFVAEVLLVVGFAMFVAFAAPMTVSLMGGRWTLERAGSGKASERVVPLLAGILILWIITAIPVIGALASLAVTLLGLGAGWMWTMEKLGKPRDEAGSEAAAEA